MQIKMISTILRLTILSFLLFICINIVVVFFLLRNGIEIESLDLGEAKISGLYLKLDKKLILDINQLELTPKESETTPLDNLKNALDDTKLILSYFEQITIKTILYEKEKGSLVYNNERFYLSSSILNLESNYSRDGDTLSIIAENGHMPQYNIRFNGLILYDLKDKSFRYHGSVNAEDDFQGGLRARVEDSVLYFELFSNPFTSMDFLKKIVTIENKNIEPWIYQNVKGKSYHLTGLRGRFGINRFDERDLDDLSGTLSITEATVKFNPTLPEISAKNITAELQHNTLDFTLQEPEYLGIPLQGSHVKITDLFGENAHLLLDLQGRHALDETIKTVLRAYDIHVPLEQRNSETSARINLDIDLDGYDTLAHGTMETQQADFSLNSLDFHADYAKAELDNATIIVTDSRAQLSDYLDAEIAMHIDTRKGQLRGESKIIDFHVEHQDDSILRIQNTGMPFTINFKDKTELLLPRLDAHVLFNEKNNIFTFQDISLLYPHSAFLKKHDFKSGSLRLSTEDFRHIRIDTALNHLDLPLSKDGVPITELQLEAQITPQDATIHAQNHALSFHLNHATEISFKGLDLNATKVSLKQEDDTEATPLSLKAEDSNIFFKGRTLPSDRYTIQIDQNATLLDLYHKAGKLKIEQYRTNTYIDGQNLNDTFVNSLTKTEFLKEGTFQIEAEEKEGKLRGSVKINNTKIKDFETLNNTFALIDSIPSLVTFRSPGYADDGYLVTDGHINFVYSHEVLVIEDFFFKGGSVDMKGEGVIDLEQNKIEMHIDLQTIKSLSRIIDTIPIVGYIIMGDDGTISTRVQVTGDLDDPDVTTLILEDTLQTPINILKRIITSPFKLFGGEEDKKEATE